MLRKCGPGVAVHLKLQRLVKHLGGMRKRLVGQAATARSVASADNAARPHTGMGQTFRAHWAGRVPDGLTHVQAASLPIAGLTALQSLRDLGGVGEGSRVLINGGSGGVGTFAVQLGRLMGAEVTAVCSARNAELVRDLGAHHVIDYAVEDPLATGPWDLFFDAVANASYPQARRSLEPRGVYVTTNPRGADFIWSAVTALSPGRRARSFLIRPRKQDLEELVGMVADGRVRTVIEKELPLSEIVAAHAHLETGRARGKVVLRIP